MHSQQHCTLQRTMYTACAATPRQDADKDRNPASNEYAVKRKNSTQCSSEHCVPIHPLQPTSCKSLFSLAAMRVMACAVAHC